MTPLFTYKTTLSYEVDKRSDIIIQYLTHRLKHYEQSGDTLQIILKPTFFDPTSGRGKIELTISASDNINESIVRAEIIPTSITREGLYVLGSILLLWTLVALVLFFSFGTMLTVIVGWAMTAVFVHFIQKLNQGKLANYVNELISGLKHVKANNTA